MHFFPPRIDRIYVHDTEMREIKSIANNRLVWNERAHAWVLLKSDLFTVPVQFSKKKSHWCLVGSTFKNGELHLVF